MNAGNIFEALEAVVRAFDALGIRYHIGGSIASSAYGIARATLDVDLQFGFSLRKQESVDWRGNLLKPSEILP